MGSWLYSRAPFRPCARNGEGGGMIRDQFLLDIQPELIVDLFAGGGGASTGIEMALGRHVDIAVNHNPEAISMHEVNHPQTQHFISDVFEVDPCAVTQGRPIGLLHASPDCTHHSQARGGQPRSRAIRALSWVVLRWAGQVRPRVITLENVEQILQWSPLVA
jgi:DNA (cytosine-5)-methyltransferase 1